MRGIHDDNIDLCLCQGTHPVISPARDRIAYQHGDLVQILELTGEGRSTVPLNGVFIPCDWLDDAALLACRDGTLWKVSLDGRCEVLLQGGPFSPWYVDARVSPDRNRILAVSDDTKADVGAGARSLWILEWRARKAQRISSAPSAQWLDAERIVTVAGNTLITLGVSDRSEGVLYDGGREIESFAARGGRIILAAKEMDEDGLYKDSAVYQLTVGQ